MTRRPRCPDWCAGGHRCTADSGIGEHRSTPQTFTVPGAGTAVLTRVRTVDGTDHADIRLSLALPTDDKAARLRLAALLTHLRTLIGPPRTDRRAA